MTQVQKGQVNQLGLLFERHHVKLFNFFLRMTNHRAASEDMVQEVFLRILRYRRSYETGRPFIAWMYQIAHNVHHDALRRKTLEPSAQDDTSEFLEGLICPGPLPDASVNQRQEIGLLQEALARLPVEKREVLVLSRLHSLRCDEIARIIHCDTGTVRVRIHRALQELKAIFSRLLGEKTI